MPSPPCSLKFSFFTLSNFFPNFYYLVQPSRAFSISSLVGRSSTASDKGRKGSPATSSTSPLLAISLSKPINQRADSEPITMLFSQTRSMLTLGIFLPGTSLMARDLPLGPSDAPCSGKTSTVHGESLSWVMLLHTGNIAASVSSASTSDQARRLIPSNPFKPEICFSPQISSIPPASRRASFFTWSAYAKLGFSLAGLDSIVGPSLLQRPMSTTSTPTPYLIKPRSVTSFLLSNYSKSLDRLLSLDGRRLHLRKDSPWLLWINTHTLRTLVLDLYVAITYESNNLTVYVIRFPISICRRDEFGYRISMSFSSTTSSKQFKHRSKAITTSLQIWYHPPLCVLGRFSPNFDTVDNKSLIDALFCLQSLVPASTPLAPSSTSPRLLTGTILSSIDSLVAARSTNRDLTCTNMLSSLGFKALMELMSIFFSYPLLALGNVLLCNVGNFRVSVPLFSLYLISFE